MKKPKVLKAAIPADLIVKVYEYEGWQFKMGERRVPRVKELYDITVDVRKNVYIATRKQ